MRSRSLLALLLGWAALGVAQPAHGLVFQTVQFADGGVADPVWGQGITLNVGATVPDGSIPPVVLLDFVGWRTGDAGIGSADRTTVYLHVYASFAITPGGAVDGSAIGNLLAVSSNSNDLETPTFGTDVIWDFAEPSLDKATTYYFVLADDTVAATPGDFSNLIYSDMVVGLDNPYAGGQHYAQTGDLGSGPTSRDLFFRVQSTTPEPSAGVLLGLGVLSLSGLRRAGRARIG